MSNGTTGSKANGYMPLHQNDQAVNRTTPRAEEPESPSKRDKLLNIPYKTKVKSKALLTKIKDASPISGGDEMRHGTEQPSNRRETLGLSTSPEQKSTARKISDKTRVSLHSAASAIAHPQQAVKGKITRTAASKISTVQRSRPSRSANVELLEAYDSLSRAESSNSSRYVTSEDEPEEVDTTVHRERIAYLEAARESARVAWATSHVRRVRVVPKGEIKLPRTDEFLKDAQKKSLMNIGWLEWFGHMLLYHTQDFSAQYIDDFDELPFDLDTLKIHLERTVMASAPWQSWLLSVRSIYRWEDPKQTGRWLALFVLLWYAQHIMGFLYLYIIYLVLSNRYYPTSIHSLRQSLGRTIEREGIATEIGELMEKHGPGNWLEPLLEELGPQAQLQLGDIANMLEVFQNFYNWKSPAKTAASLWFFASCLLFSLLADMKFCMKVFWFIAGGSFFLCWPIASLYPKYRYLVSPFKWVLWDIPTHAEWSFEYLRQEAQAKRSNTVKSSSEGFDTPQSRSSNRSITKIPKFAWSRSDSHHYVYESSDDEDDWHSVTSSTSLHEDTDTSSFRAQYDGVVGKLILSLSGARFRSSVSKKTVWQVLYRDMVEMHKDRGSRLSKVATLGLLEGEQLEFRLENGESYLLEAMRDRDMAFNEILGLSGRHWQALQTGGGKGVKEKESK